MTTQDKSQYIKTLMTSTIVVADGQTIIGSYPLYGAQIRGILFPSNWTACSITFKPGFEIDDTVYEGTLSDSDGTFPLAISTVANQFLPLVPWLFDCPDHITIIRSVEQSTEANLILLLQPLYQGLHT